MSEVGPQQLARLLVEHGGALTLYARQWCSCAEDVVQEALIQLVRQEQAPDRVVPWLYRVVRNGAISAGRAENRRRRYESAAAENQSAWFTTSEGDRLDAEVAQSALERLPQEQRETIVARVWGGLTFDEIAAMTGSSSSSAHRWYETGLAALRQLLGVKCPEKKSKLKT
jgi:RNA polymerase sigma-70 factor (ECF subfamily)